MKKSIYFFMLFVLFFASFVVLPIICVFTTKSDKYKEFEKETWLNIEQLSEKYNVDLSTIYERYQEIKSNIQNDNKQTLDEELFNALTKHQ